MDRLLRVVAGLFGRMSRWPLSLKAGVLSLLVLGGVVLSGCSPTFSKVIIYQFAGIEDYQIFPNLTVKASTPQPWGLANNYNKPSLEPALLKTIESFGPVAFLVLQDGKIVYERYWEGHSQNSYSASFSMAKSIVGMLVGIALEEGKIKSLDQPIADFIPDFRVAAKAKITFRHMLTMTSGLDWDEAYTSPFSPTTELYYGENLRNQVVNLGVKHEPGKVWYYSSADTQILGIALEAAVGQPLSEYASEKIWKPIGAEQDASWSLDREKGTIKSNCCFNSTPRDFARLGQLVLQKGSWNNKQIVPPGYLSEATKSQSGLRDGQGNPVDYYGYQFWVAAFDGQPMPYFNGILGQYIFVIPHLNAVVVRLGHRDDPNFEDARAYQRAAVEILKQNTR